jgi:hypothetical protein
MLCNDILMDIEIAPAAGIPLPLGPIAFMIQISNDLLNKPLRKSHDPATPHQQPGARFELTTSLASLGRWHGLGRGGIDPGA